ncbi:MAG: hypothetical protein ACFB5Z_13345 [Elainellaceae cyanobacterium]
MRTLSTTIKAMARAFQQGIDYLSSAAGRFFSLSDDDYPKTGSQPFEGNTSDDRQQNSTW